MGVLWVILLGPAFHHLFVLSSPPPETPETVVHSGNTPGSGRVFLTPDRLVLEDTLPGGTLQVRLSGLSSGMGALSELEEARVRFATPRFSLAGGNFPVRTGREIHVSGLQISSGPVKLWGGETRSRKEELWIDLTPGVRGPYPLPVLTNPDEVEVWWRGRRLPKDRYRLERDGSLWLEGFPDILPGDRLLVRLPLASEQIVTGGEVRIGTTLLSAIHHFPSRLSAAAYDTAGGVFVFVGEGKGHVQPVFFPVGEGRGDYRFDPSMGGFRYVGPGEGTHRARLVDLPEENLLGATGHAGPATFEAWGLSRGEEVHPMGLLRVGDSTLSVWGGIRDTSLRVGTFFPGPWSRLVGMRVARGEMVVQGEGNPETRKGRAEVSFTSRKAWFHAYGMQDEGTEFTAEGGVSVGGGLSPLGRVSLSPLDTLVFAGLRFEDEGLGMDAGIRVHNGTPREEVRVYYSRACSHLNLFYAGEEPVQGEFRWCRGKLRGEHRRELSFFPGLLTFEPDPVVVERHRLSAGPVRTEILWDERTRFQAHLEVLLPSGALTVTEARGGEPFREVRMFWNGRRFGWKGSYVRTGGTLAGEALSFSPRIRLGPWSVLGAYDRRKGTLDLVHTAGGAGYTAVFQDFQGNLEVWYHRVEGPAWFLGFPQGWEVRLFLSGVSRLEGGILSLSGGVTARQDGWIAPTVTFTFQGAGR